jgi:hypothetical protein
MVIGFSRRAWSVGEMSITVQLSAGVSQQRDRRIISMLIQVSCLFLSDSEYEKIL